MLKDLIEKHALKLALFIIYAIPSIIYLIGLFNFNIQIVNYNVFEIIISSTACSYLLGAIFLLALGILYLFFLYKQRWEISEYPSALPVLIVLVFLTVILIITIVYAIQNPILRAFLSFFIIGQSIIYMTMNE